MATSPTHGTGTAAHTYEEAMARFADLRARDDHTIAPDCRSFLLTPEQKTARVIVLLHGMTNAPCQFVEFAPQLFALGYNVLVPRLPRHGLADKATRELALITVDEMKAFADLIVDIAAGLGDEIIMSGISAGGVIASYAAQTRPEIRKAFIMAPFFGLLPHVRYLNFLLNRLAYFTLRVMPNRALAIPNALPHGYLAFQTKGLQQILLLGRDIFALANRQAPAVAVAQFVSSPFDDAVSIPMINELARRWQAHGVDVRNYSLSPDLKMAHDIIDPGQSYAKTAKVYPILLDLIAKL